MSTTGGRRPATHNVFAIEDGDLPLPNPIALDTSFVVEALLATQPLHGVCDAFLTRIFNSGISVVTNELLRAELAEATFANAMKERWGGKWRAHRTDGRTRPRAGRLLNNTLARYDKMLESLPHISVRLEQVADSAPEIMTKYGLASYDAIQAASAIAAGTGCMTSPNGDVRVWGGVFIHPKTRHQMLLAGRSLCCYLGLGLHGYTGIGGGRGRQTSPLHFDRESRRKGTPPTPVEMKG